MFLIFCFIVVAFFSVIILTWLKGDAKKLPITLATTHFIVVAFFSVIILIWTKYNEEAGMAWVIFDFLDWPISLLFGKFYASEWYQKIWFLTTSLPIIKGIPDKIIGNVIVQFVEIGILGSIQYYVWGLIISKISVLLKKINKR